MRPRERQNCRPNEVGRGLPRGGEGGEVGGRSGLAETIGRRIRDLYEERGWSQQELAWRAKLSITKVSCIVTGDQGMSAHILLRLARAFDVSADYLLGLTENKRQS